MYYVCETEKMLENVVKRSELGTPVNSAIQKLSIIIIIINSGGYKSICRIHYLQISVLKPARGNRGGYNICRLQ